MGGANIPPYPPGRSAPRTRYACRLRVSVCASALLKFASGLGGKLRRCCTLTFRNNQTTMKIDRIEGGSGT
jgi:hypothetical protein